MKKTSLAVIAALSLSTLAPRQEAHAIIVGAATANAPLVVGGVITALGGAAVAGVSGALVLSAAIVGGLNYLAGDHEESKKASIAINVFNFTMWTGIVAVPVGLILDENGNNVVFTEIDAEAAGKLNISSQADLDAYNAEVDQLNILSDYITENGSSLTLEDVQNLAKENISEAAMRVIAVLGKQPSLK